MTIVVTGATHLESHNNLFAEYPGESGPLFANKTRLVEPFYSEYIYP